MNSLVTDGVTVNEDSVSQQGLSTDLGHRQEYARKRIISQFLGVLRYEKGKRSFGQIRVWQNTIHPSYKRVAREGQQSVVTLLERQGTRFTLRTPSKRLETKNDSATF